MTQRPSLEVMKACVSRANASKSYISRKVSKTPLEECKILKTTFWKWKRSFLAQQLLSVWTTSKKQKQKPGIHKQTKKFTAKSLLSKFEKYHQMTTLSTDSARQTQFMRMYVQAAVTQPGHVYHTPNCVYATMTNHAAVTSTASNQKKQKRKHCMHKTRKDHNKGSTHWHYNSTALYS